MNAKTTAIMRGRYHAIFSELCAQFDLPKSTDQRHQVNEWILGYNKSSSQWTGKEYSLVIDQMKEWIRGDIAPHALSQQDRNRRDYDQSHKQIVYAIEQLGAPEAYIQAICNDRHAQRPWRDLGTVQLKRLRMTITARMAAKRRASKTRQ